MTLRPFPGYDTLREVDVATMRRLFFLLWPEAVSYTHLTLPTTPYV